MKKLNRRERTIVRLMLLTVGVWLFLEVWERYEAHKLDIQTGIESMQSEMDAIANNLEGESVQTYTEQVAAIEDDLEDARDRIMELPREADASLLIRSTLDRKAGSSGLNINSISSRRSKPIKPDSDVFVLPTYIGYDTDLAALLEFFGSFDQQGYFLAIDSVNISSRTPLRRPRRRGSTATAQERSPLTGNAVLLTLFRANENASMDQYQDDGGSGETTEAPADPQDVPGGPDDLAANDEDGEGEGDPRDEPEIKVPILDRNGDGVADNPRDQLLRPNGREPVRREDVKRPDPKPRGDMLPDSIRPTKPSPAEREARDPANRPKPDSTENSGSSGSGNSLVPVPEGDEPKQESTPRRPNQLNRPPKPLTGTASIKKNRTGEP